jgi:hypothetical protein
MEPDYKRAYNELISFVENFSLNTIMKEKLPLESQTGKILKGNENKSKKKEK